MIKKTDRGYQVLSESGKPLSDDDLSYMQAKDRLNEVEFFKRVKAAQDEGKKLKSAKPKKSNTRTANTGGKTMEELLEMKKQQEENEKYPHGRPDVDYVKKFGNKTNANEPNSQTKTNPTPPQKKERPFDHFERIKKGYDKKHQKSIDEVIYER